MRISTKWLAIAFTACAPTLSQYTGQPLATIDEDTLRKRAGFELSCDPKEITVTVLEGLSPSVGPWSAGVSGCGKKAVYKFIQGAGWVANAAVTAE